MLSAGCDSTTTVASNDTVSQEKTTEKNDENSPVKYSGTDYNKKNEVADIAGAFTINGTISNGNSVEGKFVKLYETEGKDIFLFDSAKVSGGKFTMAIKNAKIGIYKIGFKSFKLGEFIVNPNEKELDLTANALAMDRTIKVTNSQENEALSAYKGEYKKHEVELKKIRSMKAETKVKLDIMYKEEAKLNQVQETMADKYPDTFFAKMVRRWQSPNRFDKGKYWNDIDFTDISLIRSMVLNDRIQDYMRIHASKDGEDGFLNAVDQIYSKSSVNEDVMNFMLYTMMEGFYTSGMTDASLYIVDNYIYGDACGDQEISNIVATKAAGLRSLQIGQIPPDFSIPDLSGKTVNLRNVASKNDLTLILFWASWCHKCEQEMPVIKRIYNQYKEKGFEIIGVSVDMNKPAWENGIKAKQCDWINVSQLEGWQSAVAKDYRVSSTPVMFLVDSKGELLLRPDRAFKLEKWMSSNFQ